MESNLNSFFTSMLSSISASNKHNNMRSLARPILENENLDTNISNDKLKQLCRDLQNNNVSLRADRIFLIEVINRVFEVNFDANEEISKPDIRSITDEWKLKVTEIVSTLENEIVELKKKLEDNHRNESTLPSNLGNVNNICESCLKIQEEVLKENEFLRVKLSESQRKLLNQDNNIKVESRLSSTQNELSLLKDKQLQLEVNFQSTLSKNSELENSVNTLKKDFIALKNTNYEQAANLQQFRQAIEDLKLKVEEKKSTLFNFNQPSSTTTNGMTIFSSDVKTNSSEFLTPEKFSFTPNIAPAINLELSSFGTPNSSNSSSAFISPVSFKFDAPNTPIIESSTSTTTSSRTSASQLLSSSESSNVFDFSKSTFTMSAPQPPISSTAPSVFGKTTTTTPAATTTVSAQPPISSTASSVFGKTAIITPVAASTASAQPPISSTATSVFGKTTTPTPAAASSTASAQPPISSTAPSAFGKTATATPAAASTASAQPTVSSTTPNLFSMSSTTSVPFIVANAEPISASSSGSTLVGTIPIATAIPVSVTDNARIVSTDYSQTSPTSITVTSPVATNRYGITRAGTICKNCLRKGSRCWQHPL